MATPSDVIHELTALHTDIAKRLDDAPTGIEPGFDPLSGATWLPNGKARYRKGGISPVVFLAQYEMSSNQARSAGSTSRIDFNSLLYDPQSLVTTGASWHFTPPTAGIYRFTVVTRLVPSALFSAGEKLYMVLWPDNGGTLLINMAWEEVGITETGTRDEVLLQGVAVRACTTSDSVHVRFSNGTGNSISQRGSSDQNYSTMITIERLSL